MENDLNPYSAQQSDYADPGQAWLAGGAGNLRLVYWGLRLIHWGIILVILGFAVVVAGALLHGRSQGMVYESPVAIVGLLLLLLSAIFWLVGPLLCLPAPSATGARALIIISVVLQLTSYAMSLLPLPTLFASGASGLFWWGGLTAFVLFMRQLAVFIAQPALAARATRLLIGGFLLVILGIALPMMGISGTTGWPLGLTALAVLIVGLSVFVMFANLVNDLRKTIGVHLSPK